MKPTTMASLSLADSESIGDHISFIMDTIYKAPKTVLLPTLTLLPQDTQSMLPDYKVSVEVDPCVTG